MPLLRALSEDWRRAEDVAATVAFLASDEAGICVGQVLGPNSGDLMP